MLEDLRLLSYGDFWCAVPIMAGCIQRSGNIRILDFAGNATIGSHEATFASLLTDAKRKRRYRILLLSPLSVEAMADRGRSSGHSPREYVARILGTLQCLRAHRARGFMDVSVRLYRRDPNWYLWIFDDCAFVDSHALGVGRRSPRFQFSGPRPKAPPDVFESLFENAWEDPGNIEVDFDRFDAQIEALQEGAEARLERIAPSWQPEASPAPASVEGADGRAAAGATVRPESGAESGPEQQPLVPSVWNVRAETYASPTHVLSHLRRELERSSEFLYFGATGESRFGKRTADFSAGLVSGAARAKPIRVSLISPMSDSALEAKLRVSLSGRTLESTREDIDKTRKVLQGLREEFDLDLDVRFRKELGATRAYLFDDGLCLSPFEPLDAAPPPCIYFRERNQHFLVNFFRRHFFESWDRDGTASTAPAASPEARSAVRSPPPARDGHPSVLFDAQKFLLTIGDEQMRLPRAVLFFLVALAYERGSYLPLDHDIDGRPARRRRTELGVRLGHDLAREVIDTVPGLGYRFQPWVKVVGTGQVGGSPRPDMDSFS